VAIIDLKIGGRKLPLSGKQLQIATDKMVDVDFNFTPRFPQNGGHAPSEVTCFWNKIFGQQKHFLIGYNLGMKPLRLNVCNLFMKTPSDVWSITCHMGSHSIPDTQHRWMCPPIPSEAGWTVLDLPIPEGWKAECVGCVVWVGHDNLTHI